MTKKDYVKLAKVMKDNYPANSNEAFDMWHAILSDLIIMLTKDNCYFGAAAFTVACTTESL